MDTFVVALFDSETDAFRLVDAMQTMQADADLIVHGGAILTKDAAGEVTLKDAMDTGPRGWATGVIAGGLVGLIAGPAAVAAGVAAATVGGAALAGAAAGSVTGGLFGITSDLFDAGIDTETLEIVSTEMRPGRTALVASVDERTPIPLEKAVAGVSGAKLFRQPRVDVFDDKLEQEAISYQGRDEGYKLSFEKADEHDRDRIRAERVAFHDDVADLKKRIAARKVQLTAEFADREAALDEQIAKLDADAKIPLQERKAELMSERERRFAILGQAEALARKAISSS